MTTRKIPISQKTIETLILAFLAAFMIATRFHHFGDALHLPDASLAIFLAAGFFLRRWGLFIPLIALAGAIDYLAINVGGVSAWCITAAYVFLVPTYAAMWHGGDWFKRHTQMQGRVSGSHLLVLAFVVFVATSTAFLISNYSFYAFSGRFADMTLAQYTASVTKYYLPYMTTTFVYVAVAALVHGAIKTLVRNQTENAHTA
jgi:hypothetical protein